jgi:hypothetical protein
MTWQPQRGEEVEEAKTEAKTVQTTIVVLTTGNFRVLQENSVDIV